MTHLDLQRRLHDQPFKPFRIRMSNSSAYDVLEPWMIIISKTSAIVVTQATKDHGYDTALDWRTISIAHIVELADIDVSSRSGKKRPA